MHRPYHYPPPPAVPTGHGRGAQQRIAQWAESPTPPLTQRHLGHGGQPDHRASASGVRRPYGDGCSRARLTPERSAPDLTVQRSRTPRHAIARATALAGVALASAVLLASSPRRPPAGNQGAAEATLFQLMNGARVNNGRRAVQQNGDAGQPGPMAQQGPGRSQLLRPHHPGDRLPGLSLVRPQRAELQLGRREHRLEQRLQRRRFAGRHPPGLHGLARPPRQHPGAELHARRRGRLWQGQRQLPGQAAQPALLHRALHAIRLGSATASTLGGRRRWWQPATAPVRRRRRRRPQPARRATSHKAKPHAKPLHVDAPAAPRASSPMDGGTLVAAAPGSASTEAVRALAFAGDAAAPAEQPGGQPIGRPAGRVRRGTGTRPVRDRPGLAARFRPLAGGRERDRIGPNPSV